MTVLAILLSVSLIYNFVVTITLTRLRHRQRRDNIYYARQAVKQALQRLQNRDVETTEEGDNDEWNKRNNQRNRATTAGSDIETLSDSEDEESLFLAPKQKKINKETS